MLPRFEVVARRRPVALVSPASVQVERGAPGVPHPLPQPAPYVAAQVPAARGERASVALLAADGTVLRAVVDDGRVALEVTTPASPASPATPVTGTAPVTPADTTRHRSRRHGRVPGPLSALAVTLTGTHLTALTRERDGAWVARARHDLAERVDTRDEAWLAGLTVVGSGAVHAGGFGQLGLRDLRLATHADGTAYRLDGDGPLVLTATSAGPGFFDTGHTSVWTLDPGDPARPDSLALEHRGDLFFRRPDRPGAFGDHATHLVRDGDEWLVATSTWGDFDPAAPEASVEVTLARTGADLLHGRHLLDTRPLPLPVAGLSSVGVWDPHLVRTDDGWLVGFVSATRFFAFHPALAAGPDLDRLALRGADPTRTATEGTTLTRLDGRWVVLASDGPDGRRGRRRRYPVLDLDLVEIGTVDAPYPTNIPWPTVVPAPSTGQPATEPSVQSSEDDWLLVTFDGTAYGGPLPGYGTHGDVVIMRGAPDRSRG